MDPSDFLFGSPAPAPFDPLRKEALLIAFGEHAAIQEMMVGKAVEAFGSVAGGGGVV